jgi:hypothetical protein
VSSSILACRRSLGGWIKDSLRDGCFSLFLLRRLFLCFLIQIRFSPELKGNLDFGEAATEDISAQQNDEP